MDNINYINKKFNNKNIRIIFDKIKNKYYICIIDIVNAMLEKKEIIKYSKDFKNKLREKNIKYNRKEFCNIENLIELVESTPTKNSESVKFWLLDIQLIVNDDCNGNGKYKSLSKKQLNNIKTIFNS